MLTKEKTLGFNRPIALALGGGGARGFAHIGVLRILEQKQIPIKLIAGTSMGAIVGALYAQLLDSFKVEEKIKEFLKSPLFQKSRKAHPTQTGPGSWMEHLSGQLMQQIQNPQQAAEHMATTDAEMLDALNMLLDDIDIRNTRLPFVAVASDLFTGRVVILRSGSIIKAVLASSAMPGILSPVEIDDHVLSDGAATSAVPIRAARSISPKAHVIAVDVSSQLSPYTSTNNPLNTILRNSAITGLCYHKELVKEADILIQPHVKLFSWSDFEHVEDFIAEGELATLKKIRAIRKLARII